MIDRGAAAPNLWGRLCQSPDRNSRRLTQALLASAIPACPAERLHDAACSLAAGPTTAATMIGVRSAIALANAPVHRDFAGPESDDALQNLCAHQPLSFQAKSRNLLLH